MGWILFRINPHITAAAVAVVVIDVGVDSETFAPNGFFKADCRERNPDVIFQIGGSRFLSDCAAEVLGLLESGRGAVGPDLISFGGLGEAEFPKVILSRDFEEELEIVAFEAIGTRLRLAENIVGRLYDEMQRILVAAQKEIGGAVRRPLPQTGGRIVERAQIVRASNAKIRLLGDGSQSDLVAADLQTGFSPRCQGQLRKIGVHGNVTRQILFFAGCNLIGSGDFKINFGLFMRLEPHRLVSIGQDCSRGDFGMQLHLDRATGGIEDGKPELVFGIKFQVEVVGFALKQGAAEHGDTTVPLVDAQETGPLADRNDNDSIRDCQRSLVVEHIDHQGLAGDV